MSNSDPLSAEIVEAFAGLAPADVIPTVVDPADRASLDAIPEDTAVILRMWEVDEHGIRQIEIEALYAGRLDT